MLYEIGSTSLYVLGVEAKQDAWIAILLATIGGLFIVFVYTQLQRLFPEKNLVDIILLLLGKFLGIPLALIYGLYFFYKSAIVLREFSELILISYLPRTPVIYVSLSLIIIIIYVSFLGLEVLGRTSEIFLPIVILFILTTFILVISSGRADIKELTPILGNGIKPVIFASYPRILNFPFGEATVFLMYTSHLKAEDSVTKTFLLSAGLSGLLIALTAGIVISVLGVEFTASSTIPFIQIIKLIDIGGILTNLDAIGVSIIFIGGFYKIIIYFYGTILVLNTLFKIENSTFFILPIGICVLLFSYFFINSFIFSLWLTTKVYPLYLNTASLIINPILLLCIAYIKIKHGLIENVLK
jgi:spore germination protein KB